MAAEQIKETCTAKTEARQQEGPTSPADTVELEAILHCVSGR
jgi:hypothetical protein